VEEFKRGINRGIRRKLIEAENPPASIEQWYQRAMALDKNWRESRKEKERLRKKKVGGREQKQERQSLPRPLVWQRRQPLSQQATTGPASIEGVERTNAMVLRKSRVGQSVRIPPRWDLFAMEVNQDWNCYACRGFRHMARHCRNQGQRGRVVENRRVEYGGERIEKIPNFVNNLKEEENLELLN